MEKPTVLDTTVLSNFACEGDFAVLSDLPRVSTVPAVERELAQGVETYPYLSDALAFVRSEKVAILEPSSDTEFSETLGSGENQVLAVVEERGGVVVTDDMDARSVAYDRGMDVTGSIGVLVRAVERSIMEKETANRCLSVWIEENGYRSPSEDLTDFL
jgi:predicted nucleic acid-binding protein